MTIKMTMGALRIADEALAAMLDAEGVPGKIGIRIARMAKAVSAETTIFNERRDKLIRALGAENPETKAIEVTPENRADFVKQLQEMLEEEVTLPGPPFAEDELERVPVKPKYFIMLGALKA